MGEMVFSHSVHRLTAAATSERHLPGRATAEDTFDGLSAGGGYYRGFALSYHSPFFTERRFTIFAGSRHRRDAAQIVKHFHLVLKSLIRVEAPFAIFASFCSKSPLPFPALLRPFQPIHDHGLIYCLVHQQLCRFHHGLRLRQLIQ